MINVTLTRQRDVRIRQNALERDKSRKPSAPYFTPASVMIKSPRLASSFALTPTGRVAFNG